ncbi:hypothetical protein EIP91_011365 [Steccherinum ochraceum]|uniref:Uncharacterized protein n=1 Tax=Steccherinum ochraceum TaxID=92696 RepID=A0A4R0RME4_9APHY|nr:hypothetical protein EIP91_011365 [Steccherinum ochraceum]
MEYRPRHPQPFTVAEAARLDVPIITEEIARLEHSINHLERTQTELSEFLANEPDDEDFSQAFAENRDVIGSQKERIAMLRLALSEKGIPTNNPHYEPALPTSTSQPTPSTDRPPTIASQQISERSPQQTQRRDIPTDPTPVDDDGGIDL